MFSNIISHYYVPLLNRLNKTIKSNKTIKYEYFILY